MKNTLVKHVEEVLKKSGLKYRFIPLPQDLPMDINSHMAFHGKSLEHAMATIVYKTDKGLIAALKRADTQINEKKLKKLAGVTTLVFATKEDLASLDTAVGLVPYIGLPIPYFVDEKVLLVGDGYGTPGAKTLGMVMNAGDIVKINKGTIGDFTNFEKSKEMLQKGGQRILSGITPSGDGSLHIGNYLGAVKQFIKLAGTHECFLMFADLHALTTIQDKKMLEHNIETLILNEIALIGDIPNVYFFRQSDVPMHTELQSILNNITPLGLLKRAHAYKDKLAKDVMEDTINVGLFSYPMLMAADILIYKPDLVPVGKDQKQHIEITRDIGDQFNKTFRKNVFPLPEPYIPEDVAVVLGTDGKRKMSKTLGNLISIFENEDVIKKQVNGTYTDPTRIHATDPGHIEGNMVFAYLDHFGKPEKVEELKKQYTAGSVSDVQVKEYLYESLLQHFADARKRYADLKSNPDKVKEILHKGTDKVRAVATKTMEEVRSSVGLTTQYSFFHYSFADSLTISIDEFARVEQRVGKVIEAANVQGSEKLIRLVVDFGSAPDGAGLRTIFTGVRPFGYTPADFQDKQFFFVVNLAPRKMMNEESQGMILAVDGKDKPLFLSAQGMPIGAAIR